ncbi:tripartite motif-containing protein 40 isoform X2 [Monodon monoceros]|uniref:tripartite motif-containing protein 40 isoform X2 n=1 Tax=Monodon monoceros TaxID=40151 RepID=UPI0010F6EDDD|nr:tripartite motif-containing protein 40 isoform X2 [Monodon monoceros]
MLPLREDSQEEGICPICQECLKEAVRTDCRHLFCRACLAQHLEKASASGVLSCPLCRKPCSEGVLGAGYTCDSHQKKVCLFCEESRCLLCVECRVSPEHKSHCELAIENAISHYKERLNRRIRKLRKDICELQRLRAQEEERLQAMQQRPGQLEDMPAEVSRIPGISRAMIQLSSLVTELEGMAKKLDASLLKDASDLLNRSAPEQLEAIYPNLEKRINESLNQPSSVALTGSSLDQLISDSPQPPCSPSPNLSSLPLGLPSAPSGLPPPEHATAVIRCLTL